ncbi:MAG: pyrimidine/purine nucleoside phosphorylase [Arenicella sp.]
MLETNDYFDGNVKSIAFESTQCPATVGVMAAGEYQFSTAGREIMSVVSGTLKIKFAESNDWQTFNTGDQFDVGANTQFGVIATVDTAYLCLYPA